MNESSQIINSTINNLTTNLITNLFYEGSIQYNETYVIKIDKDIRQSILSEHKTRVYSKYPIFFKAK